MKVAGNRQGHRRLKAAGAIRPQAFVRGEIPRQPLGKLPLHLRAARFVEQAGPSFLFQFFETLAVQDAHRQGAARFPLPPASARVPMASRPRR